MPYITTAERIGMEKGARQASIQRIVDVLEARFGKVSQDVISKLQDISEIEQLSELIKKAATMNSLEAFIHCLL